MSLKTSKRLEMLNKVVSEKNLSDVAYKYFKSITPYDKGNARRNTKKLTTGIEANYPYAKRLDEGYSKQAPKGMVEPTWEEIKSYIKKTLG